MDDLIFKLRFVLNCEKKKKNCNGLDCQTKDVFLWIQVEEGFGVNLSFGNVPLLWSFVLKPWAWDIACDWLAFTFFLVQIQEVYMAIPPGLLQKSGRFTYCKKLFTAWNNFLGFGLIDLLKLFWHWGYKSSADRMIIPCF